MRGGLAADGTLDGASVRPHAVLLDDNRSAFVAEAVPAGQDRPLQKEAQNPPQ